MTITSHDMISEHYLRLNISSAGRPSGSIDFISEEINFNITGQSFFKGMAQDLSEQDQLDLVNEALMLMAKKHR